MSDNENNGVEQKTEENAIVDEKIDVRSHPAFRGVVHQINEKDQQLKELTERLNAYEEEKKQQEQAKMEEAGEYKTLLEKMQAEKDSEINKYKSELESLSKSVKQKEIENQLIQKGITNKYTLKGLTIEAMESDDIDAFLNDLDVSELIEDKKTKLARPNTDQTSNDVVGLEEQLSSPDPQVRAEARRQLLSKLQ